jgi:hypothetical protein
MGSQPGSNRRFRVWIVVAVVFLLFIIPAAIFYQRTKDIDDWTRDWVVRSLSERFASRVELGSIHVSAFPEMSATGENLTIYYHNRTDVPPLIRIRQFTFHLGFMGILRVPRHIRGVHIDDMVITIPPRGMSPGESPAPPVNKKQKPLPQIVVDQVVCDETTLLILPKQAGKDPLDFDIHDLLLKSVGTAKPFSWKSHQCQAGGRNQNLGKLRPLGNRRSALDSVVRQLHIYGRRPRAIPGNRRKAFFNGEIFGPAG